MKEALPVLLGFCFGDLGAIVPTRPLRVAYAVGTTGAIALAAFLVSGEFHESWTYGLLDLAEAAMGFAVGSILVLRHRISAPQK